MTRPGIVGPGILGRTLVLAALLLASALAPLAAAASGSAAAPAPHREAESPFELGWLGDGLALGSGLALCLGGEILEASLPPRVWDGRIPGRGAINPLDRLFVRPPSSAWGSAGDVAERILGLSPLLFLLEGFGRKQNILPAAVMYAEAGLLAASATKILKCLVPRLRPYVHTPEGREGIAGGDFARSFPSGHAATAFAGASFCSYAFSKFHPDSPWRVPVAIASYGLACFCGASRVAAGMHFPTDVLAGALIGTLAGVLVPRLHLARDLGGDKERGGQGRPEAFIIPGGFALRMGF